MSADYSVIAADNRRCCSNSNSNRHCSV